MIVIVSLEKKWSIAEVEDYIRNPNDKKYIDMPGYERIELMACAERYAAGADEESINSMAAESIASEIEDYFYEERLKACYDYYATQIALNLDDERKQNYIEKIGPNHIAYT